MSADPNRRRVQRPVKWEFRRKSDGRLLMRAITLEGQGFEYSPPLHLVRNEAVLYRNGREVARFPA